jgi:hypothetical protein
MKVITPCASQLCAAARGAGVKHVALAAINGQLESKVRIRMLDSHVPAVARRPRQC